MTCNAVLIKSDKNGIVVIFAAIRRWFRTFIEQLCVDKSVHHLPADAPLLEQIGVHPAHIGAGRRKRKGFFLSDSASVNRFKHFSLLAIEQPGDRFRIRHPVEFLQEGNRSAAFFLGVIVPMIPTDRDTAVAGKPLFKAGGQQFLALSEQELFQINLSGAALLLI